MVTESHRRLMKMSFWSLAHTMLPRGGSIFGLLVQIKMYEWQRLLLNVPDHFVRQTYFLGTKSEEKGRVLKVLRFSIKTRIRGFYAMFTSSWTHVFSLFRERSVF